MPEIVINAISVKSCQQKVTKWRRRKKREESNKFKVIIHVDKKIFHQLDFDSYSQSYAFYFGYNFDKF